VLWRKKRSASIDPANLRPRSARKNLLTAFDKNVPNSIGGDFEGKASGQNSSYRCSRDQIKASSERFSNARFESRQEFSCVKAEISPAAHGKYLKRLCFAVFSCQFVLQVR